MSFDTDELEGFVERYDQLVENTLNRYREEFHNADSSWNFQESKDFEIAWDMAQDTYIHSISGSGDVIFDMKMAEAAVQKDRDQSIDWEEAKRRLAQYGFPKTQESISNFLPTHLATWASDEIINHAVATDVLRQFNPSE